MTLLLQILAIWGCIPELAKLPQDCMDMTNSSSTYLGIAVGAAIGGAISWWIYNRQNKTSLKQDHVLQRISELEQKNGQILLNLETFVKHNEEILNRIFHINKNILELDKKIQSMTDKKRIRE